LKITAFRQNAPTHHNSTTDIQQFNMLGQRTYSVGSVTSALNVYSNTPCPPKKHVTTFSTITLTISVRLQ